MKAMILAAGRGERLRPLTDTKPKPLLEVAGKPLIVHQLEALARGGVRQFVINLGYMGEQIHDCLGDGSRYGVEIRYSEEGATPLETAGGIIQALPMLGDAPFIIANADVFTDFDYRTLINRTFNVDAHLVLVDNPPHHPAGDFVLLTAEPAEALVGRVATSGGAKLTYSGLGLYHPRLFHGLKSGKRSLAPLLFQAAPGGRISGEHFSGMWHDIGTLDSLTRVNEMY